MTRSLITPFSRSVYSLVDIVPWHPIYTTLSLAGHIVSWGRSGWVLMLTIHWTTQPRTQATTPHSPVGLFILDKELSRSRATLFPSIITALHVNHFAKFSTYPPFCPLFVHISNMYKNTFWHLILQLTFVITELKRDTEAVHLLSTAFSNASWSKYWLWCLLTTVHPSLII